MSAFIKSKNGTYTHFQGGMITANHPLVKELLADLRALKDKCDRLEISQAMYVREARELAKYVPDNLVDAIRGMIWGPKS